MLEQRARFRGVRDRSVFVGNPDDVVPDAFGPGLPSSATGPRRTSTSPATSPASTRPSSADRAALRAGSATAPDERVCVVTVGGSGVGAAAAAPGRWTPCRWPGGWRPDLRFLVVTGPRIDPASLPRRDGVRRCAATCPTCTAHLAACDVAVVQGGLTTCMELTASRTPFVYVPLRHHFEQNFHVRHRLERYGAGRCLDYEEARRPDALAAAVAGRAGRPGEVALPAGRDRRRRPGRRAARRPALTGTASRPTGGTDRVTRSDKASSDGR